MKKYFLEWFIHRWPFNSEQEAKDFAKFWNIEKKDYKITSYDYGKSYTASWTGASSI